MVFSPSRLIEHLLPSALRPYANNTRTHRAKQIRQIARSIERFGFNSPVLVGDDLTIIAGHGRVEAAKLLGLATVPIIRLSHLSPEERRAYILADNKLALNAGWDQEMLAIELHGLAELNFDLSLTGFEVPEIDFIIGEAQNASPEPADDGQDEIPPFDEVVVTQSGDLWELGRHRLLCGDARDPEAYQLLLGKERPALIFTDPPYNVPIDGHVCGLGSVRHREFAMAAGEMSEAEFTAFLVDSLSPAARLCRDVAIAYVCMDWRHMGELLAAGRQVFTEFKNLCVWNKTNGGMGAFYRSKHELVFVFKVGTAPHTNNFGLGDRGRYRTNVWDYAGISTMSATRGEELAMHPTVKPVPLVRDALLDCSNRGDVVLDMFGGSGTTLIAAQKTGRRARLIEYDPRYCDVLISRFQWLTGRKAKLVATGQNSDEVADLRLRNAA